MIVSKRAKSAPASRIVGVKIAVGLKFAIFTVCESQQFHQVNGSYSK